MNMEGINRNSVWYGAMGVAVVVLWWMAVPMAAQATENCASERPLLLEIPVGNITQVGNLTEYIAVLYQFIIAAVAILSAVMLMFNGMRWATAGGSSEMLGVAKGGVVNAIIGLLIALTSFLLLNVINPQLTNLSAICPTGISVTPIGPAGSVFQECNGDTADCTRHPDCQNTSCKCVDVTADQPNSNVVSSSPEYKCVPNTDNVAQGEDCFSDDNCRPPLKCLNATRDHAGTCQQSTRGETCESDTDCSTGLSCIYSDPGRTRKECYPPDDRPYRVSCSNDAQCADDLTCNEYGSQAYCWRGDGTDEYGHCGGGDDNCARGYKCIVDPNQDPNTPAISRVYLCTPKVEGDSCDYSNADCGYNGLSCVDTWGGNECYDGSSGDPCDTGGDCISVVCDGGECN